MELGGKAPLIACEDCDVERTAQRHRLRRLRQQRAGVHLGRARLRAREGLPAAARAGARAGRASSARATRRRTSSTSGAIIFPKQIDVARRHVEDAREEGRRARVRRQAGAGPGAVLRADGARRLRPHDDRDARGDLRPGGARSCGSPPTTRRVQLANDSHLGLNAYVFTRDRARGAPARRAHRGRQRRGQRRAVELRDHRDARSAASSSRASGACTASRPCARCAPAST